MMDNLDRGEVPAGRMQREAVSASIAHRGPTADRYVSALERYVHAVVGEQTDRHLPPVASFPPMAVGDVMTREVVSAYPGAPFKEIAHALVRNGINAVPVLDEGRHVVGVVTVSDLLVRLAPPLTRPRYRPVRLGERRRKQHAATARELMTSPAITTTMNASLADAARLMARSRIRSLPVVDSHGVLLGMVARADLVRVFLRSDDEIRHDVERDVVHSSTPRVGGAVRVTVQEGVVTLAGKVPNALTAKALALAALQVPGVLGVHDELSFDIDDSILPRRPRSS